MREKGKRGPNALIASLTEGDDYDPDCERYLADIHLFNLSHARSSSEKLENKGLSFGPNPILENIIFEENLVEFALTRQISFKNPDWRDRALNLAAHEHPQLDPAKRNRGRPKKVKNLAAVISEQNPIELRLVEKLEAGALEHFSMELSDTEACRIIVASGFQLPGVIQRDPDSGYFFNEVRKLQNRVSRQRKLVGRPKRRISKKS